MRHLSKIFLVCVFAGSFFACKDEDDDNKPNENENTETVEGIITANKTLSASKKYLLKGNVFVAKGVELTIEPGTVIFGDKGTKGSLVINRGAKIHAKGTAEKPIVFTSNAPKGFRNYGDWGGVVILGNMPNNKAVNTNIEGISADAENGVYGGTATDDSSGEFYYIRIEFAGIALSPDNELNGLTIGSVGAATELHHIQVSYSGDDAFEWFGGNVNAKYLVAYRAWDDDFDTDFGYSGNVQFAVSYRDPNIADKSGSNGFESDNNGAGGSETPLTSAKFANITFMGPRVYASAISANYGSAGHIRRNSKLSVYNSIFAGYATGAYFDKTNSAAEFKNNWIIKCNVDTLRSSSTSLVISDIFAASGSAVSGNQKAKFLKGVFSDTTNINTPSAQLASGSPALSGAVSVGAGIENTTYVGAFNGTENWTQGWTNFDPQNTDY